MPMPPSALRARDRHAEHQLLYKATTTKSQYQMQHRTAGHFVVGGRFVVVPASKSKSNSNCQRLVRSNATLFLSHICLPLKIKRCCAGGMPSFSSTRSLIRSTLSVGSMSISISLPVSVCREKRDRDA